MQNRKYFIRIHEIDVSGVSEAERERERVLGRTVLCVWAHSHATGNESRTPGNVSFSGFRNVFGVKNKTHTHKSECGWR